MGRRLAPIEALPHLVDFLAAHNTLCLATVGPEGRPHAAAVFYAAGPDLTLYFLSDPTTRHGQHIGAGAWVAATIEANNQNWQSIRGLQIHGLAAPCTGDEVIVARRIYGERFPFIASVQTLTAALARARYYRLVPSWIRLIDNTRGFGHKEEWGQQEQDP